MCPANGELENGDPEAPVDFLCHVAHLRAHAVGLQVPPHGDCEFCQGGENYEDLMQSLAAVQEGSAARELAFIKSEQAFSLPILTEETASVGTSCSSGGCPSCA